MSDFAVRVENISKRYRIGVQETRQDTLASSIMSLATQPLRNLKRLRKLASFAGGEDHDDIVWALRDISFEVQRGEVLGLIGRNGAGKSTLLKILSRIAEPTEGSASIKGRLSALLEVGTGFHNELTGRENVYLNGAILGMTRNEIDSKFDEIVAFSGVERFIDTPVKRYSSGMKVRLAFSVAAHLDPDVLLVDEVLAVGDVDFQKKCLGKMDDVVKEGRTVIFVSHNMAAIQNLCQTAIVLEDGRITFRGDKDEAIAYYLTSMAEPNCELIDRPDRVGTGEIIVTGIDITDLEGNLLHCVPAGGGVKIALHFENRGWKEVGRLYSAIAVSTQLGQPVLLQHNRLTGDEFKSLPEKGSFVCEIPRLPLPASSYQLGYSLLSEVGEGKYIDCIDRAGELNVVEGDFFGSGELPPISHGVCLVEANWKIEPYLVHEVEQEVNLGKQTVES